jgi:hypothetical protein
LDILDIDIYVQVLVRGATIRQKDSDDDSSDGKAGPKE